MGVRNSGSRAKGKASSSQGSSKVRFTVQPPLCLHSLDAALDGTGLGEQAQEFGTTVALREGAAAKEQLA